MPPPHPLFFDPTLQCLALWRAAESLKNAIKIEIRQSCSIQTTRISGAWQAKWLLWWLLQGFSHFCGRGKYIK
jgi:hypothetical protein